MSRVPTLFAGVALLCAAGALAAGCRRSSEATPEQPAPGVVHLADRLANATVTSAPPPSLAPREWSFAGGPPAWRVLDAGTRPGLGRAELTATPGGTLLTISAGPQPMGPPIAGLAIELGDLVLQEWDTLLVRARSDDRFVGMTVTYNLADEGAIPGFMHFVTSPDAPPIFNDGSLQTYAIPLRSREGAAPDTPLRDLALLVGAAGGPSSLELLSVALVPRGAGFDQPAGVRAVTREGTTRNTLYAHAPAALSFPLELAAAGRLDFGLAVAPGESVTYRVAAAEEGGERRVLFEETVTDEAAWQQRSVDLASLAGRAATLVLEAASESAGSIALWGAPVVSTVEPTPLPNVVFYVIDGGGADLMSVYGYERPTTPFLEKLAAEAVVFERAYSNSTWTQPSTVSFMTSLQHSVLGGLRRGVHSTPVPAAATTMAERFRAAGYQTASFTSNPNAGRMIGLERGVDYLRDVETKHHSTSSLELHEQFWKLRESYPGHPFWVHFQTTDVHEPNEPEAPWAGRWVSATQRQQAGEWEEKLWQAGGDLFGTTSIAAFYDQAIARAGVPRRDFYEARKGLYDETMAHQDHALEQLVGELKSKGEWDNTILVIAADHGHPAGTFARFGRGLFDPQPEPWEGALFDAYATRVPLIVVWPGRIQGGRRIAEPVSMIDVLPTLLDLAGLPQPEVLQGQSLAPLLRGEAMEVRPVILDEFRVDEATGEMVGNLEIIDGRWGASMEIGPVAPEAPRDRGRHAIPAGGRWGAVHPLYPEVPRLLLYDLAADPFARKSVHAEHPEVADRYRRELYRHWQAHQALMQRFTAAGEAAITPEQLQQLRTLGYIQ